MKRLSRRRRRAIAIVVTMTVAVVILVAQSGERTRREWFVTRGRVRRVTDGDSFTLSNGERVRLLEIDAPEIMGAQGDLARKSLGALVKFIGGKVVRLEPGPRMRDKYDRMLAYVFVEAEPRAAEVFVNAELVRAGLARAKIWEGPGARWDAVLAAEAEAKEARRGMWAADASPIAP
jgi:endonuclease YncB( thermonuclease family)